MKRLFDLFFAMSGLLLFGLPMLFTALLIACKLGSPVLFKQQRPGLNGKPFILYKFRTMTIGQDKNGQLLPDSMRLTEFGKFIRKFSLDELPQFYNVLKGDMSLIGPRPLLMEYLPLYTEQQAKRNNIKPGITGLAQVSGRNAISWEEKLKLDTWYVENRSFFLDLKILLLTVIKVFKSEGISQAGHVTADRFRGTKSFASGDH